MRASSSTGGFTPKTIMLAVGVLIAVFLLVLFIRQSSSKNFDSASIKTQTPANSGKMMQYSSSVGMPPIDPNVWKESNIFYPRDLMCKKLIVAPDPIPLDKTKLPPQPRWNELTEKQQQEFTLGGRAQKRDLFFDDRSLSASGAYRRYTEAEIDELIAKAKRKEEYYYGATDTYLYNAISEFPIAGKNVVILGSLVPWFEAVCVASGAKTCTTIEYNKLDYAHPKLKTMTNAEYFSMGKDRPEFDVAFSISSYEHDGLARYGDPVNPFGDLQTIKMIKCVIKEGGQMFFAVPNGADMVMWNAHRIYGRTRMAMITSQYMILKHFGLDNNLLDQDKSNSVSQPVWVLQNTPFFRPEVFDRDY